MAGKGQTTVVDPSTCEQCRQHADIGTEIRSAAVGLGDDALHADEKSVRGEDHFQAGSPAPVAVGGLKARHAIGDGLCQTHLTQGEPFFDPVLAPDFSLSGSGERECRQQ